MKKPNDYARTCRHTLRLRRRQQIPILLPPIPPQFWWFRLLLCPPPLLLLLRPLLFKQALVDWMVEGACCVARAECVTAESSLSKNRRHCLCNRRRCRKSSKESCKGRWVRAIIRVQHSRLSPINAWYMDKVSSSYRRVNTSAWHRRVNRLDFIEISVHGLVVHLQILVSIHLRSRARAMLKCLKRCMCLSKTWSDVGKSRMSIRTLRESGKKPWSDALVKSKSMLKIQIEIALTITRGQRGRMLNSSL